MLSVSSKVIFPELPDASMDTLKPIAFPQYRPKQIFRIIAERTLRVNAETRSLRNSSSASKQENLMDNQPSFHDGFLDGLLTSQSGPVRVFLRTMRGEKFTLLLEDVLMLTLNEFREGNIIFGVDFLDASQLDPSAVGDCDLAAWIEKAREKQLRALQISASYGGTLVAMFRRHVFADGYVTS